MTKNWTEVEIAAFIGGRLRGPDADRVAEALETDPAAQAVAEALGAADPGDEALRQAFAVPLSEALPAALRAAVLAQSGKVAMLPLRTRPAWLRAALVASVSLVAGFGAGWGLRPHDSREVPAVIAVGPAKGAVELALSSAPSGTAHSGLAPTATFRDSAGNACREFDVIDAGGAPAAAGVACRDAQGWRVLLIAAYRAGTSAGPGFAPASGADADPVGDYLMSIGAGPTLHPEEEALLIARGWR